MKKEKQVKSSKDEIEELKSNLQQKLKDVLPKSHLPKTPLQQIGKEAKILQKQIEIPKNMKGKKPV